MVFSATEGDLVTGDYNNGRDVFLRDLIIGTTTPVTFAVGGGQANGSLDGIVVRSAVISDGSLVAYHSDATNIVSGDTNNITDVFVHEPNGAGWPVETTPPTVMLTTPAEGAYYTVGQSVTASYTCADQGGSGLASCTGTAPSGTALDTATAGSKSFAVTATDTAGNATTVTHTYTVVEPDSASGMVAAGGTVSTDSGGTGATPSDPVETTITTPNAGTVSIHEGSVTESAPSGFSFFGQQVDITAPPATPQAPLEIGFDLSAALLPPGQSAATIEVFKDGALVPECPGATTAPPGGGACVSGRETVPPNGDVHLTVLTTSASHWNLAVPPVAVAPSSLVIQAGTLRKGGVGKLLADDNAYVKFNSTTTGTRTTKWYGAFNGVPAAPASLQITYRGKNSTLCTQKVSIWNWATSSWVKLDKRSVGTAEVGVGGLSPPGSAAAYVGPGGQVQVQLKTTNATTAFTSSSDLLQLMYPV